MLSAWHLVAPSTPTFGASPPILAGRGELIEEFGGALEDGPGAPGRATIYSGARGTGKTVLLNAVEARGPFPWLACRQRDCNPRVHSAPFR